jgi:hypothetical protein
MLMSVRFAAEADSRGPPSRGGGAGKPFARFGVAFLGMNFSGMTDDQLEQHLRVKGDQRQLTLTTDQRETGWHAALKKHNPLLAGTTLLPDGADAYAAHGAASRRDALIALAEHIEFEAEAATRDPQ